MPAGRRRMAQACRNGMQSVIHTGGGIVHNRDFRRERCLANKRKNWESDAYRSYCRLVHRSRSVAASAMRMVAPVRVRRTSSRPFAVFGQQFLAEPFSGRLIRLQNFRLQQADLHKIVALSVLIGSLRTPGCMEDQRLEFRLQQALSVGPQIAALGGSAHQSNTGGRIA